MKTKTHFEVNLPFQGFYGSVHDACLDSALERDIQYAEEQGIDDASNLWDKVNWKTSKQNYLAKWLPHYMEALEDATGIDFDYQTAKASLEMTSPREYNFETDRLFVKLPRKALRSLLAKTIRTRRQEFQDLVRERHSSRSGFISYYPSSLVEWGHCDGWDHNQWGTLLLLWRDDVDIYAEEFEIAYTQEGLDILNAASSNQKELV